MAIRFTARLAMLVVLGTAAPAVGQQAMCGTRTTPPVTWAHVVWIVMENHGYDQIIGNGAAPFINRTLLPSCGLATNYHNITHPSLPNYIAMTSGLSPNALGPFRSDCNAVPGCRTRAPSIFAQAPSWRAYEESMPSNCHRWFFGHYAASHNPPVYYKTLPDCPQNDVQYRQLQPDLDADRLPAFAFITPNLCDDMHSCAVGTGDAWLSHAVARLTASAAYQRGDMAIFVTFDEGEKGGSNSCATNTSSGGCHVATIVISPSTSPHARSNTLYNHYSLLRTTEEMLGIPTLLGKARTARSMRAAFNL